MAIDYKEEWYKFKIYYRNRRLISDEGNDVVNLGVAMQNWINDTIESRERLMEEYVKGLLRTNIAETHEGGHLIEIRFKGGPMYGKILITEKEFRTWLKNRKEVK